MPPRYAYWTILIDGQPTAFRAREREELQPTLVQLQRKSANVTMRWFARGKLWDSREAEQADFQEQRRAATEPRDRRDRPPAAERRGNDWRPGGTHKDPRDRFKKKNRPERAWSEKDPATQRDRDKPGYAAKKPWADKPRGDRPWRDKPGGAGKPNESRRPVPFAGGEKKPWTNKPRGEGSERRPAPSGGDRRPGPFVPGAKRPWQDKPRKPWENKPAGPNDRPWQTKPTGPRAQRKPWIPKPSGDRPLGGPPRSDRPWQNRPQGERPWQKPADRPGTPRGDRPPARSAFDDRKREGGWEKKGGKRPWSSKPPGGGSPDRPRDPNRKPSERSASNPRKTEGRFNPRAPRADGRPPRPRDDDE
jgi:hypothetical protein